MKDPRIDSYLERLGVRLSESLGLDQVELTIREAEGHLEEAIEEFTAQGHPDPVGAALASFGSVESYEEATEKAGGGVLLQNPQRGAIRWLAATLLIPICADLIMDLSSLFTGSDSALFLVGVPVTLYLAIRFGIASGRLKKLAFVPVVTTILLSFLLFIAVGGVSRCVTPDGFGTQARGTGWHRLKSLQEGNGVFQPQRLSHIKEGYAVFTAAKLDQRISAFRTLEGYEVPPQMKQGDRESLAEQMRYGYGPDDITKDFQVATARWTADGPAWIEAGREALAKQQKEIHDLDVAVHSSWLASVRSDLRIKLPMLWTALYSLVAVHVIGFGAGVLIRRNKRRPVRGA